MTSTVKTAFLKKGKKAFMYRAIGDLFKSFGYLLVEKGTKIYRKGLEVKTEEMKLIK